MRNVINENQYLDRVLDAIWDYCSSLEQYYYDTEEDHSYMPPEMQNLLNINNDLWTYKEIQSRLQYVREKYGIEIMADL